MTKRTIYKYLNLAYLSPKIVNQLLSGTQTINLQNYLKSLLKTLALKNRKILSTNQLVLYKTL